jgi:hypothetical protein
MPGQRPGPRRGGELAKQLAWFVGLWVAGVATLGLIALIIRAAISV